jgi:hypothetical protein
LRYRPDKSKILKKLIDFFPLISIIFGSELCENRRRKII